MFVNRSYPSGVCTSRFILQLFSYVCVCVCAQPCFISWTKDRLDLRFDFYFFKLKQLSINVLKKKEKEKTQNAYTLPPPPPGPHTRTHARARARTHTHAPPHTHTKQQPHIGFVFPIVVVLLNLCLRCMNRPGLNQHKRTSYPELGQIVKCVLTVYE